MGREEVLALVDQGLDSGRLVRDEGPESLIIPQILIALIGFDELDLADDATKEVLDHARRRGSVVGLDVLGAQRAYQLFDQEWNSLRSRPAGVDEVLVGDSSEV
jgi:hypothetical protein